MGLKSNPAVLKSLSQAGDAGRGVLVLIERLQIAGNMNRDSLVSETQARYPSNSLLASCVVCFKEAKKSSSSDELLAMGALDSVADF